MFKFGLVALFVAIAAAKDGSEFNGDAYIAMTRQQKSDKIWGKITENTKSGQTHLTQALIVDENPVFDTPGDELACSSISCRKKTIHSLGNVAKIQWKSVGSHPYTGMFKGADTGYARLSVAKPVTTNPPNMVNGMGVKLLRDGYDSANFVCMYSVDGQDSLNWFASDFVNHIPDPKSLALKPLSARFATATDYVQAVSLSEMASYTQDGKAVTPVFPFSLRFAPSGAYSFPDTVAAGYTDFREDLKTIKSGSVLYKVYAMDAPAELGGIEKEIAEIITQSEMTTSNWGDEHMYIRHQRMEDEFQIKPEWEPYNVKYGGIFSLEQQEAGSDCPFAHLLQYLQ